MKIIENFLKQEKIPYSLAEIWDAPDRQRLSSLCYLEQQGQVLLLLRKNEPFAGYWTAPGGKLEPGEEPRQTVIREMQEETGLTIINPRLQLIASESGVDPDYNWLLFVFRADQFTGTLKKCEEGLLSWVAYEQISHIDLTNVDQSLWRYIYDERQRYFVRLYYNDRHEVDKIEEFPI